MDEKYFEDLELMAQLLPQVSAQIRTAMGNIQLSLDLLQEKYLDNADDDIIRNISLLNQSYYRLLRLSKNLSAAELLSNEAPFTTEDVELAALVGALLEPIEALAAEKGLAFSFSCDQPYILTAVNVEQFRLLLYHLLSNALKFTPAGGKVQLELKGGKNGEPILLSVSDNGCGISAEDMENLFDHFYHADAHPLPNGLGLGLPLCRAIARRHGGMLVVDSTAGKGTTVTVSLQRVKPKSVTISDIRKNYEAKGSLFFSSDGYNYALTQLADALPYKAFDPRHLE
ncbi:MAG: HAMP domain-containing histidine kinase [Oscillospiraceae bacterium]|nr:HAMP domain-containing histidine kinase [Oscillospiraceae bacterium]